MEFADRLDAGRRLAPMLEQYASLPNLVVLALPRGGVPVAYPIAHALSAPLDVFLVRELSAPGNPDLILGALTSSGKVVLNYYIVQTYDITQAEIDEAAAKQRDDLQRQVNMYRGSKPPLKLEGKVAVVVDEGMTTGASMRSASSAVAASGVEKTIVAVPISSKSAYEDVGAQVDEIFCLETPDDFEDLSAYYTSFAEPDDSTLRQMLGVG